MNFTIARTYRIDHNHIAIEPSFDHQLANKHFDRFREQYDKKENYGAFKSIDAALVNRPGYGSYLENKAFLLQRLGYSDDAFKMYRQAQENKGKRQKVRINVNELEAGRRPEYRHGAALSGEGRESSSNPEPAHRKGRPHRLRQMIYIASVALALAFTSQGAMAQSVDGYVTDKNTGNPLQGITVEAVKQDDDSGYATAQTDADGYYLLDNFTPVTEHDRDNDAIRITRSGNRLHITVESSTPLTKGRLTNISGQTIASMDFRQQFRNSYSSSALIHGSPASLLIFNDGIHKAVKFIPSMLPGGSATLNTPVLKSGMLTNNINYVFTITDNTGTYETLKDTAAIDAENTNRLDFELNKKKYFTIIKRRFRDPLERIEPTADIIISNPEFNYQDTIFAKNLIAWRDTVPVNPEGTEYTIKIIPHVREGDIPYYTLTKTFFLKPEETAQGYDDLKSLEQQQKIKGKIFCADTKENLTGGIDIIIWNYERTEKIDSIRSLDGTFEFGPFPANEFTGKMDVHIPNNHPTRADTLYFGHKDITIIKETDLINHKPSEGVVIMKEKITAFEDSIKTYNVALTPTHWIDAETGQLAKVNPAHLYFLDGDEPGDLSILKWGEINVYFTVENKNKPWMYEMAERIEKNFGIPYKINEVETRRDDLYGVHLTSLEDEYLNSIRDQTGLNITVSTDAGLTVVAGTDEFKETHLTSTAYVKIRGPPAGDPGSAFDITGSERELLHRLLGGTNLAPEFYKSIGNGVMPYDMDTTKMLYDHINYQIIYNNRKLRINPNKYERADNGSITIRPNKNEEYYNNIRSQDYYWEEQWLHWDTTNIPEMNKKFFE